MREVDEATAAVVRRIYADYAAGMSAIRIAYALNAERIPAPRGGIWTASTLIGHRKTAFGILANPIYVGQLIYGRSKVVLDPRTRRKSMKPGDGEVETGEAPHLRIIDDALWRAVQDQIAARSTPRPERQRRPKHLLSGLGRCGVCGGNWVLVRKGVFGCAAAFQGKACGNRRMISQRPFERRVLAELTQQMLAPEAVEAYLAEYRAEHARRAREAGAQRAALERRRAEAARKVERLVAAIADGGKEFAEVRAALAKARAEREQVAKELAGLDALPQIALHPGLARQYRAAVENLAEDLQDEHARREAAPRLRALIARIVVTPRGPERRAGVDLQVVRHIDEVVALATRKAG